MSNLWMKFRKPCCRGEKRRSLFIHWKSSCQRYPWGGTTSAIGQLTMLLSRGKKLGWGKNRCGVHAFAQRGKSHHRFSLFYFLFSGKESKKTTPFSVRNWRGFEKKFPAPCYSPIVKFTVPSPLESLTYVFGKGTGVSTPLWAPEKNITIKKTSLKKILKKII